MSEQMAAKELVFVKSRRVDSFFEPIKPIWKGG